MEAKYLLLPSLMLTSFVAVYGIKCYAGASVNSQDAVVILYNCTECGSQNFNLFDIATTTYTCYTEGGISCTYGCCSTDLCNSGTNVTPWMIGSGLMMALRLIFV
ncbi:hypothetical protein LSH36_480g00003 [Paralvinella palmiformis]|uniref:Uncharacterized protein n=1 Tax=Paralvinella palmiformis TaxID=53620 RepID=A0AAD9J8Z3_9ANNE|nr:hypothetical protein LSH36_480g00003 [Paralvinella palmiformis]